MTTPYTDPNTVHTPTTGASPPASWGVTVRNGLELLVRPPGCVLEVATPFAVATATWVTVPWNGPDLRDTDNFHTGTTDAIVIPAGFGGWYRFQGNLNFAANATGLRMARYTVNNAGDFRLNSAVAVGSSLSHRLSFAGAVLLNAGDVFRLGCWQNSGGSLNVNSTSTIEFTFLSLP
jgi:hypothetical protein